MHDTEGHMNVEWHNKRQVVKYLFMYATKGPDQVGSKLLESLPCVRSGEVVKYFKYVMKGSDWVGSECMLKSTHQAQAVIEKSSNECTILEEYSHQECWLLVTLVVSSSFPVIYVLWDLKIWCFPL